MFSMELKWGYPLMTFKVRSLKKLFLRRINLFVKNFIAKKINNGICCWFFSFFRRLVNIWNQIGRISLSFVNIQHIGVLKNDMFIHGNHTMALVIHKKTFLIPCVYVFASLSTFFLVDKWYIVNHICWFKRVYNSKRIINLKKNPHVIWWKGSKNFWFTCNWRNCCWWWCASTCKTSSPNSLSLTNSSNNSNLPPPSSFPASPSTTFASLESIVD